MKGKTWLFWGGLIAAAGGVLFQTSYDVQDLEEKLAGLNRKIIQEQESIQVLKAEWSYLNDPTKLEQMAQAYLALQPTEPRQYLAMDVIPMRPGDAVQPPAQTPPGQTPPGLAPLPPMVRAPGTGNPQVAAARAPAAPNNNVAAGIVPVALPAGAAVAKPLPMDKALERAPVIVPASLPSSGALADPSRATRIKPAALVPGSARAPMEKSADRTTPDRAAGKLAPNAPTSRPTELAARPTPAPAPVPKTAAAVPAAQPYQPKPTDSLGLLVARLGANR
ncbi:cell division protein FtsL [Azospirillum endophyticum]